MAVEFDCYGFWCWTWSSSDDIKKYRRTTEFNIDFTPTPETRYARSRAPLLAHQQFKLLWTSRTLYSTKSRPVQASQKLRWLSQIHRDAGIPPDFRWNLIHIPKRFISDLHDSACTSLESHRLQIPPESLETDPSAEKKVLHLNEISFFASSRFDVANFLPQRNGARSKKKVS